MSRRLTEVVEEYGKDQLELIEACKKLKIALDRARPQYSILSDDQVERIVAFLENGAPASASKPLPIRRRVVIPASARYSSWNEPAPVVTPVVKRKTRASVAASMTEAASHWPVTGIAIRAALSAMGARNSSRLVSSLQVRRGLVDAGVRELPVVIVFSELALQGTLFEWWQGGGDPMAEAKLLVDTLRVRAAVPDVMLNEALRPPCLVEADSMASSVDIANLAMSSLESSFKQIVVRPSTAAALRDSIVRCLVAWQILEFRSETGMEVSQESHVLQRVLYAAEKAKIDLSSVTETEINLPYLTADATGPKHLVRPLTRDKLCELLTSFLRTEAESD
jgi:hypothetical protein